MYYLQGKVINGVLSTESGNYKINGHEGVEGLFKVSGFKGGAEVKPVMNGNTVSFEQTANYVEAVVDEVFVSESRTKKIETESRFAQAAFPIVNKNNTLEGNKECIKEDYRISLVYVVKTLDLSKEEFDKLGSSLLESKDCWQDEAGENIGGQDSFDPLLDDLEISEIQADKDLSIRLRNSIYTKVVEVRAEDRMPFYVNTEGYDYARYVGIGMFELGGLISAKNWTKISKEEFNAEAESASLELDNQSDTKELELFARTLPRGEDFALDYNIGRELLDKQKSYLKSINAVFNVTTQTYRLVA